MILNYKDIVNVYFTHTENEFEVELLEIRERFGSNNGHTATPLCKGIITKIIRQEKRVSEELVEKIGKKLSFDFSYITGIVSRSCFGNFPKINIFKRHSKYDYTIHTKNKKILCGPLKELCHTYLGRLNEEILVEIDWQKLKHRSKSLTGVVEKYRDYVFTVKKDHFVCWFKKNWRHILKSKKLEHKLETERNKRYEKQYKADCFNDYAREEMDKMFSKDFKQQFDDQFLDTEL